MKFGIQLSSIAPYIQTEEGLRESLKKLTAQGYETVQLQGLPYTIPDETLASALEEAGLEAIGLQEDYPFNETPQRILDRALACGCKYVTFVLYPSQVQDIYHLEHIARDLEKLCNLAKEKGLIASFHPLSWDYKPLDGIPRYERLLAMLPKETQLTWCVYYSINAGVPAAKLAGDFAGKMDLVHFKDRRRMSGSREYLTPLGEGETDWGPIAAACRKAGTKYIFTEQERWTRDPFECVGASLRYLQGLGI